MPREFLLLQGTGCRWRKCTFCDYHTDTGPHPYEVNRPVLEQVTGHYGVLDIINSGSAPELDENTLQHITRLVRNKQIRTLWLEAHYLYRHQLKSFAERFAPATVKFRCGVESFSPALRSRWHKGIPEAVTAADIARHFNGVCLLVCTEGTAASASCPTLLRHAATSNTSVSTSFAITELPSAAMNSWPPGSSTKSIRSSRTTHT